MDDAVNPMQVQRYLDGLDYPCTKREIVSYARDQGADTNIIDTLNQLPDKNFNSPAEVSEQLGSM